MWPSKSLKQRQFHWQTRDDAVVKEIEHLVNSGFRLLLDDFGIGYAGLAHLAQLNVHGIKIDRQLTGSVCDDLNSRHVISATIDLASKLGVEAVAEGVETLEQIDLLLAEGASIFQGYGVARPMPLEEAIDWAREELPKWRHRQSKRASG